MLFGKGLCQGGSRFPSSANRVEFFIRSTQSLRLYLRTGKPELPLARRSFSRMSRRHGPPPSLPDSSRVVDLGWNGPDRPPAGSVNQQIFLEGPGAEKFRVPAFLRRYVCRATRRSFWRIRHDPCCNTLLGRLSLRSGGSADHICKALSSAGLRS